MYEFTRAIPILIIVSPFTKTFAFVMSFFPFHIPSTHHSHLAFFSFFATCVTSESPCIFVKMNYSPLQRPERGRDGDWHSLDVHVYCCRNVYLFHRSIGYQFLPTFLCHSSHRNTVRSIEYGNV